MGSHTLKPNCQRQKRLELSFRGDQPVSPVLLVCTLKINASLMTIRNLCRRPLEGPSLRSVRGTGL
jgi:hypothetical protein